MRCVGACILCTRLLMLAGVGHHLIVVAAPSFSQAMAGGAKPELASRGKTFAGWRCYLRSRRDRLEWQEGLSPCGVHVVYVVLSGRVVYDHVCDYYYTTSDMDKDNAIGDHRRHRPDAYTAVHLTHTHNPTLPPLLSPPFLPYFPSSSHSMTTAAMTDRRAPRPPRQQSQTHPSCPTTSPCTADQC